MDEQIRGRVVDGTGRAVAEATAFVVRAPGPVPDLAAMSNADGRFVIDGLAAGAYRLRAVGPDGGQGEADARASAPDELVIRLSPAP